MTALLSFLAIRPAIEAVGSLTIYRKLCPFLYPVAIYECFGYEERWVAELHEIRKCLSVLVNYIENTNYQLRRRLPAVNFNRHDDSLVGV